MSGKAYDKDKLTLDIAEGKLPLCEIARKHGLTPRLVYDIVEGRRRPHIRQQLVRLWRMALEDLRRATAARVKEIMDIEVEVALTDKGHNGRMAREYVLDRMVQDQDLRLEEAGPDRARSRTPASRWRAARKRLQSFAERGQDDN